MKHALILSLLLGAALGAQAPPAYDVIVRHGTVIDGAGHPRFDADVGIRNGYIAAVGDLSEATAARQIDATGLLVTPGFINIHSHASPDALPTAVNMLTQGVTTEIFNADGGGAVDLPAQLARVSAPGLAVNVGGYIGFNVVWQTVVGAADRRPTPDEIARMRGMIAAGLDQGAWGVSAGLDYKPGYFATTEEVIRIVDVARRSRTNFTNHDRVTPESNYSSRAGIAETLAIGEKSGLVPVVTHMKVTGREKGTAATVLASLAQAGTRRHYAAADAYPYLAGQTGVGSLTIPAWAVDGGRPEMLKRFADPALRGRIIKEAEEAIAARFGGPESIYLPRTQQQLTAVMKEMNAGAGETILRILERGPDPGAIIHFGAEEDLVKILKDPVTSMACDCGASTETRVHPRFYGSFPRVLGRYVREQQIMTWEEAIRKSTWLPAATIGMIDRGVIAVGMAADIAVIDADTVIDRATYENPSAPSEGIRFVLVNGVLAVEDGVPTGAKGGRALFRTARMPSRPALDVRRALTASGTVSGKRMHITLTQRGGGRAATGTMTIDGLPDIKAGMLQTTTGWAAISATSGSHAVNVIVDLHDHTNPGGATVAVDVDGYPWLRGSLSPATVAIDRPPPASR